MGLSLKFDGGRVYMDPDPDRNESYEEPHWRIDIAKDLWVGGRDDLHYHGVTVDGREYVFVVEAGSDFVERHRGHHEGTAEQTS